MLRVIVLNIRPSFRSFGINNKLFYWIASSFSSVCLPMDSDQIMIQIIKRSPHNESATNIFFVFGIVKMAKNFSVNVVLTALLRALMLSEVSTN